MTTALTQAELLAKVQALGDITEAQRNEIICALIGHSRVVSSCFGYISCARCEKQIGDTLGGVFDLKDKAVMHHKCDLCATNYAEMTWCDKLYTPDPFAEEGK